MLSATMPTPNRSAMMEPFYVRQARVYNEAEQTSWFQECIREARAEGAQLGRFSIHPDHTGLVLVEAWREKIVPDQGPVRWQMKAN